MKTIEQTLKRSLYSSEGNLYCTIGENRYLFAECEDVRIDLMEEAEKLKFGGNVARVVSYYFSIVFCDNMTFKMDYDSSLLFQKIRAYDFKVKIQRKDGIYEELLIYDLVPLEINLTTESWKFRADLTKEMAEKLRTM